MIPLTIDYQTEDLKNDERFPSERRLQRWLDSAQSILKIDSALELTIRLVDDEEMRELNREYRGKDYATNVLSFPCEWDLPEEPRLLGDIVIDAGVVNREAKEQKKSMEAHWAHIVVHGFLHLLGYDHIEPEAAEQMEAIEREILASFGYGDPYIVEDITSMED
ncbi:MAG: rRNA maturation RNase YbeY [Cardiobacteriaceae bacterium]|nr:rRNA maturation RNase YbeY [Cardiobacteriaceae bacterium]